MSRVVTNEEKTYVNLHRTVPLMKDLWSKPEHERPWEKILQLLKLTFDSRRMLLLRSSTTAQVYNEYPALFYREAIIQEYCLVAEASVCMTKAVENITEKCQMLVKLSQQKLQSDAGIAGRTAGMNKLSHIMSQLSLAMEHESDPDIEHQLRAVAGLLLLPVLLKDNSLYFNTTLEVTYLIIYWCTNICVLSSDHKINVVYLPIVV